MRTNLQNVRRDAGFKSAKAFAEYVGMNSKTYTAYEQGTRSMTLAQAWEFADALHCSLDELAGREWLQKVASFTKDEYKLVQLYRSSDSRGQETIMTVSEAFAADTPQEGTPYQNTA